MPDRATPNLPARDFSATAAFYARLGFGESYRDPGWMILTRGDLMLDAPFHSSQRPFVTCPKGAMAPNGQVMSGRPVDK